MDGKVYEKLHLFQNIHYLSFLLCSFISGKSPMTELKLMKIKVLKAQGKFHFIVRTFPGHLSM